jgi:hypothetical protein
MMSLEEPFTQEKLDSLMKWYQQVDDTKTVFWRSVTNGYNKS